MCTPTHPLSPSPSRPGSPPQAAAPRWTAPSGTGQSPK